jgi:hypothetical protein
MRLLVDLEEAAREVVQSGRSEDACDNLETALARLDRETADV